MRNRFGKSVVPMSALRPLMEEWLARQTTDETSGKLGGSLYRDTAIVKLARESGMDRRRITGILRGTTREQENVSFDTADRLLCAMQMNAEWHIRLAEFYDDIDVAPYERCFADEAAA